MKQALQRPWDRFTAAVGLALLVAGCTTIGPNHEAPSAAMAGLSAGWVTPPPESAQVADLSRWWTQFDDPRLSQLIDAARASSPSLTQALARIRQARAAPGQQPGGGAADVERQCGGLAQQQHRQRGRRAGG